MLDEIARFVGLRLAIPVAGIIFVVASMHNNDIAGLDVQACFAFPFLEMGRSVDIVVANAQAFQVNDHAGADQFSSVGYCRYPAHW